jgi:competence protein ComEC
MVVLWSMVGLGTWCFPPPPLEPEYHQLSVGHGNVGVLRTCEGRTILFDCGSLSNPEAALHTIAPFLWSLSIGRIDAVCLSHADSDHFNALPGLLSRFPVGTILAPPQFARPNQPAVDDVVQELRRRGVNTFFIWSGDELNIESMQAQVLWPPADSHGPSDNSDSLVIKLFRKGRSILISADIAELGLSRLLETEPGTVDVFVVPHHGSLTSNTRSVAEWANARVAISSQSHRSSSHAMSVYEQTGSSVFRTNEDGCVSCRWMGSDLIITSHRTKREVVLACPTSNQQP